MPDLKESDMWGMSPIDQMLCRIQYRRADYRGEYTPPRADKHTVQYPGYNGGSDWGGVSLDPVRGVLVVNYNDMPNYVRLVPRAEANKLGIKPRFASKPGGSANSHSIDAQWGVPYAINVNAGWRMKFTKLMCKRPPYGGIRAIDVATGKTLWDRPFGTAWLAIWATLTIPRRFVRDLARLRRGACIACGYDLNYDFPKGCPECGWRRGATDPHTLRS
jgi:quinoprotein glucose dehydrogenase